METPNNYESRKQNIINKEIQLFGDDKLYIEKVKKSYFFEVGEYHGEKIMGFSKNKKADVFSYYKPNGIILLNIDLGDKEDGLKNLPFFNQYAGKLFREDTTGFYRLQNGKEKKLEYDSREYFEFMMDISGEFFMESKKDNLEEFSSNTNALYRGIKMYLNAKENENQPLNVKNKKDIQKLSQGYFRLKNTYGTNTILENYNKCETVKDLYIYMITLLDWYKKGFFNHEARWYVSRGILTFSDFQYLDQEFIKKDDPQYASVLQELKNYYLQLITKKYPISGYLVDQKELDIAKKYLPKATFLRAKKLLKERDLKLQKAQEEKRQISQETKSTLKKE